MVKYTIDNQQLTLLAEGQDIIEGTNTVQFNGLARPMTGNFDHAVYLLSQQNTDLFAKAGVTVFEKPIVNGVVDSTTRFATFVTVPNGQTMVLYRTGGDLQITKVAVSDNIVPLWLRLKRSNNDLIVFYSTQPLNAINKNWQPLITLSTFFSNWSQVWAGMMGLSKSETLSSTVVFKGLNFGVGLPYEIDFDIESITWSRAFQGLSALLALKNPSNKSLSVSKDGVAYTGYTLFENLNEGQSYTFYVRDDNNHDGIKTKTETAPVSTGCSMSITTIQVIASTAGRYNVTVNISNPDSYVIEYKMDNEPWKNNGTYTDITSGSHTFSIRNRDKTACVKTRTQNIGTVAAAGINEIAEIPVPAPENLNEVDLLFLGEWDVPLHPNPKYADQRVFESILKGPLFRHQVATVGNIFKKGWTGIDILAGIQGVEWQRDPYSPTFVSTLNIKQTSVVDGGPSYPQLKLDNNSSAADIMSIDYANYIDITNDYASNIPQKFNGSAAAGSKYQGKMVLQDHEGGLNNVAIEFGLQDYVNRVAALHKAVLDGVSSSTLVGLMYQGAPKQNVGFGFTRATYDEPADEAYTMVCAATQNSITKNFPAILLGKSIETLDDRILAVVEVYFKYEAVCVPEGTQLKSLTGENLKSQNGVTLPLWTHFGVPQNDGSQANYKPSYLHWATHTAGCIGLNKKHLPANRFVLIQTNNFNAGYFFTDFGNTPTFAIIQQHNDGFSRYKIPNYIVAGIEAISFFSGAFYYQWEGNYSIGNPESRSLGETLPPYPQPSRLDYHGLAATQAMAKRLVLEKASVGSQQYQMIDLIDGTEVYLMENIKVNYLTRTGFTTTKQIYPTDWMAHTLPPVMAIVHLGKGLIAIWATVAYPGSTEVKEFEIIYDQNGYNFRKRIILTDYKNSLHIFDLNDTDLTSGGGGDTGGGAVTAPVITSSPSPVVVGSPATYSTLASGTIEWFKNGINQNVTGSSFAISNVLPNDEVTAKRTVGGIASVFSNAIKAILSPPVITSNPSPVASGSSVTYSTTATGFIRWYKNDVYDGNNGSSYTITSDASGLDVYATREINGVESMPSNKLPTPSNAQQTIIIEPAKPAFYFTNGQPPEYYNNKNNLPAIHQSGTRNVTNYTGKILSGITMAAHYDPVNDLVWIKNSKVKFGINLLRGGQIAWASLVNETANLVYNGYDGGFQISIDAYQKKDGFQQNGKYSRKQYSDVYQFNDTPRKDPVTGVENTNIPELASYNTTMGGDFNNNSQSLISHGKIGENGYFVKFRPIFYTIDCEISQIEIEVRYTLEPDATSLKCEYIYHSFRTDGQYDGGGFDAAAIPAIFAVNTLNKYATYSGSSPFTNAPMTDAILPIVNENGRYAGSPPEPNAESHSTEHFGCVYNQATNKTLGVYVPSTHATEYFKFFQLEINYLNGPGTEFEGGFTYFDCSFDFASSNNPLTAQDRADFTRTRKVYLIVEDTPTKARAEANRLHDLLF
jgi:hypothetical protein